MSPLEISLHRVPKNKPDNNSHVIRILNFLVLFTILGCLVAYAFVVNGYIGGKYKANSLAQKKEALQEKISSQTDLVDNLRIPTYLQSKVRDKMIQVKAVTYLDIEKRAVAFLPVNKDTNQAYR